MQMTSPTESSNTAGTLRLAVFGAAPDTGNAGVTALAMALLDGIYDRESNTDVALFDHGRGERASTHDGPRGSHELRRIGAINSRRVYRGDSWLTIRTASLFGGLGNRAARAIHRADAILDISGGDSFTDLYGARRFHAMLAPKRIALGQDRPLVLLPQTYGPYRTSSARCAAQEIVRGSALAWARDPNSYEMLRDLLGDAFDSYRHRQGVDLAFLLRPVPPDEPVLEAIRPWLSAPWSDRICINVSGLLYNEPERAQHQFGLRDSYRALMIRLVRHFIDQTDAKVLLLPHVEPADRGLECDIRACTDLAREINAPDRILITPAHQGPRELKWIIGESNWFCGTRMHSTIAALSSNVAAAAIAYSPKTAGVFATCGLEDQVADPRRKTHDDLMDRIIASYDRREVTRIELVERLTNVYQLAEEQLNLLLQMCWRYHQRHDTLAA
ncbi:MAG: polysaccharide pyruvyl transferase family protein [Planctomycetota bacterium]